MALAESGSGATCNVFDASGALVTTQGWGLLNAGSLLPVALTAAALLWLAVVEKPPPPQTA